MDKRNELNQVFISDGLTCIQMVGEKKHDTTMSELVIDLTKVDKEEFQDVINAVSVLRDVWDKHYDIAKGIRTHAEEK